MPEFIHDHKVYYNPAQFALDRIGGTWKMPILWRLKDRRVRYSELRGSIARITDKMLSAQLKVLESEGFILREAFAEVPPRVEYRLTDRGRRAIEVIEYLRKYGLELMEEFEIPVSGKS
jgi:DNA-binding HxlR family transcriptional regulator